jgi:hypothetical protein
MSNNRGASRATGVGLSKTHSGSMHDTLLKPSAVMP